LDVSWTSWRRIGQQGRRSGIAAVSRLRPKANDRRAAEPGAIKPHPAPPRHRPSRVRATAGARQAASS